MTDFNKGDFTQQGVDGHVNAKLRLNAKRYVDIDLTSNERASGCPISGHVYDSLNNITYPIGSAKTLGERTFTENGTFNASDYNVDGWSKAVVNVRAQSNVALLSTDILNLTSGTVNIYYAITLNEVDGKKYAVREHSYNTYTTENNKFVIEKVSEESYLVSFELPLQYNRYATASELVNCTFDDSDGASEGFYTIAITDITQPASIKITINPSLS